MKKCNKCNETKELTEYHKDKSTYDGYKNACKECRLIINKEYIKNNPNIIRKTYEKYAASEKGKKTITKNQQNYYHQNKEKCNELSRKWNKEHSEFVKKYNKEFYKLRKIYDKDKIAWRTLLTNSLKRLGKKKEGHTIDLLGYSSLELKNHLTSLFTEGMSWDNYGEWHIDHIKSVFEFDNNTSPSIVNALSNLRPLWSTTRVINGVVYEGNLNRPKALSK
jgi:hypothetical protein